MSAIEKRPWTLVALLSLIALGLRVIPQFDSVFQESFVNFQETDAWFHVRTVESLVRHFPWRPAVDAYLGPGAAQGVATGPFYDWLLAGLAMIAGLGNPSEALVHTIAAWYPAVLGACIVPVVFVLARSISGVRAGLIAAAVIATLPGHFFIVSSLGFTDHHVMESLLSAAFLVALLDAPRSLGRAVLAGLVLAAYLLTFVGGAFFVGIVVAWAAYDQIRSLWPRDELAYPVRPFAITFMLAAFLVAPQYKLLWMPYTIASLLGGAILVVALSGAVTLCQQLRRPRAVFFGGLAVACPLIASVTALWMPGVIHGLRSVIPFFFPAYFGTTGAVEELQALIFARGTFTLIPAWKQFAGAFILSVVALVLLAEAAVLRPKRGTTLLFVWGSAMLLLAMGQLRMTYYCAVAAAVLSGYLVARLSEVDTRPAFQWIAAALLLAGVFVPNIAAAMETGQQLRGVPDDWRQSLEWMRQSTPEPFGDPAAYYQAGLAQQPAYSVMAWWDYGYWIQAIGRRVPVSNPTQANASLAASFYLAQTEAEALQVLSQAKAQYAIVNSDLPLLSDGEVARGNYPDFFVWDKSKNLADYFLMALEPAGQNQVRVRLFYRPAYFRSMAVHLFLYGAGAVPNPADVALAEVEQKLVAAGKSYPILKNLRRFDSYEKALEAERACSGAGCILVSDNPQASCVPLEAITHLRPAFASSTAVLGIGSSQRSAVQVYAVTP